MATTTTEQIVREAPEIEAYKTGLLQSAKEYIEGPGGAARPDYQYAGMSPDQLDALATGRAGIGAFQQYIDRANLAQEQAQGYMGQGMQSFTDAGTTAGGLQQYATSAGKGLDALGMGVGALYGAAQAYRPEDVSAYMNPYQQQVINEAIRQIDEQGDIQQQALNAQAVRAGAFGGSREGIQRAELAKNLAEAKNAAIVNALQQGYGAAQSQAQQAFEQQQQRQLLQAQGLQSAAGQYADIAGRQADILGTQAGLQTNIGQGIGALGSQLGNLAVQQAALGQTQQQLGQSDVNFLYGLGQAQQADLQAQYDVARANAMQPQMQGFENLAFLSDIYKGAPSSQMAMTAQSRPTPSPFQQLVGLGAGVVSTAKALKTADLL